jgi:RNA polymerase sigma factor CnrH
VDTISDDTLAELLAAAAPRLLSLARRIAPAGTEPADLAQDALERAWGSRTSLHDPLRVEPWLRRILVNRARDLGRRAALREEVPFDDALPHGAGDPPADLATNIIAREESAALRAALRDLPAEAVVAVVLRDGEDWTPEEVGDLVGTSPAAAHKRIQRGRAQLATALLSPPERELRPTSPICAHAPDLARAHVDGTLSPDDEAALAEHLATCTYCPATVRAVEAALTLLHARGEPTPDQLARLRQAARPS